VVARVLDDAAPMARRALLVLIVLVAGVATPARAATPPWLINPTVLVQGNTHNLKCRHRVCPHNENTDLIRWHDAIWLVHRTAVSQVLGPNSSLRVSRSTDGGATFKLMAIIPATKGRDIRDPAFFVVGRKLFMKAITRVLNPKIALRDVGVHSVSVVMSSPDGRRWSRPRAITKSGWGLWRVIEHDGTYYGAAYEDGDKRVVLYRSTNGLTWTPGPLIYGVAADTPLEAELVMSPSGGHMLALVRMDGNDQEVLGAAGRLRTKVCWATPPFDHFDCPQELTGVRLDGPRAFFWNNRLFVVARKHLQPGFRKRTALYEIGGNFEGGPLTVTELGELPSAGDTSYAGVAPIDATHVLVTWYTSPPSKDVGWLAGYGGRTDIWKAAIDLAQLPAPAS
jgi:hypothetical protein